MHPRIAGDADMLLRTIVHEDIEALMQILADEDRRDINHQYRGIADLVLSYFPPTPLNLKILYPKDNYEDFSLEAYTNHVVAQAFEWLILTDEERMFSEGEIKIDKYFYQTMRSIVHAHRHNYFTVEFFDPVERRKRIQRALDSGIRFRTASRSLQGEATIVPATTIVRDLAYEPLHTSGVTYTIKYDATRFGASSPARAIINAYAAFLRSHTMARIEIKAHSKEHRSREGLIAVYCTGGRFNGESHIDMPQFFVGTEEFLGNLETLVTIAFVAASIPQVESVENATRCQRIFSYIQYTCRMVFGTDIMAVRTAAEIAPRIRWITLTTPPGISVAQEYQQSQDRQRFLRSPLSDL